MHHIPLRQFFLILLLLTGNVLFSRHYIFFISTSGNDQWSGRLPAFSGNNNDGPFRTLHHAILAIASLKSNADAQPDTVTCLIRKGVYALDHSLVLGNLQGFGAGLVLIIRNYRDEKVMLTGSRQLNSFLPVADATVLNKINPDYRDKIMQVDLRAAGITDYGAITNRGRPGLELFFNNKKMTPARWPNNGWALIADVPQTGELVYKGELPHMRFGLPVGRHYGRITYSGNRPSTWSNIADISLHGYWVWDWYDEYLNIKSIDTTTKEIVIEPPHSHYGYAKEQRYYAMNVLEELDQPGEWYIDRKKGMLYFWPPAPIRSAQIVVSVLDGPLVQLDSTSHVTISGISFAHARGNGIVINGGQLNLIEGCTFTNLGDVAVRISGGTGNGISSCDIEHVAFGGVMLAGGDRKSLTAAGNFVVNTHIHHFSEWLRTYQSGITVSGVGNRIANNLIHDGPGSGIQLTGNEHVIEYNELHHLALETGDVGAFYMGRDWTERGNIIRYNYFHDLKGSGKQDVNAVYLDDWTSGTTVQGNIFADCARGIMIGGGRDNMVNNNIFIDCHPAVHVDSRGLGWAKYYFDGTDSTLFHRMDAMNFQRLPYSEKYPALLSLYADEPAVAKHNQLVSNIAYLGRWTDLLDGLDYSVVNSRDNLLGRQEDEKFSGQDHIVKANPGLADYRRHDFRASPFARKYGFNEIPFDKIGLQINQFRKLASKKLNAP